MNKISSDSKRCNKDKRAGRSERRTGRTPSEGRFGESSLRAGESDASSWRGLGKGGLGGSAGIGAEPWGGPGSAACATEDGRGCRLGTADGFSFPLLPPTSNIMLFRLRGKKDLDHRATLVQTVSVQ